MTAGGPSAAVQFAVAAVAGIGVRALFAAFAGVPLLPALTTGLGGAVGVSVVVYGAASDRYPTGAAPGRSR